MEKIYWRTIKRGARTFESIPEELKEGVIALAKEEVKNNIISEALYKKYVGQEYTK